MTPQSDTMRKLPPGWRWAHVGEICDLVNGDAYKESDWSLAGTPIIRIQNLNDPSKSFNYWAGPLDDRVIVKPGDVLLAWSGTPGTSFGAHLWKAQVGVLNQHIFRLDLQQAQIIPEWAVLALNHQLDILIHKAHGGVGLRHVTRKEVESLEILLPPLEQQRRIAAILEEQTVVLERARAAAEAQLEAAKALPTTYLRAVFDSAEARQWPRKRLGEACEFIRGVSFDKAEARTRPLPGYLPILRAGNIGQSLDLLNDLVWVPQANVSQEQQVRVGDIVICMSSGSPAVVGKSAQLERPWVGSVGAFCGIIRPRDEECTDYWAFWFRSPQFAAWRDGQARGANIQNLRFSQFETLEVPFPPSHERERTVAILNEQVGTAGQIRKTLGERLAAISVLPMALRRRAFSGEL